MNPPLCLWKSKIFITEIFILHVCITPSLTGPWFQSISLIHTTTDIILILPTPIKSRYGTEEIVYADLQSVFHYGFQRKLKKPHLFYVYICGLFSFTLMSFGTTLKQVNQILSLCYFGNCNFNSTSKLIRSLDTLRKNK